MSKSSLGHERIVATALSLADAQGLDRLTMRRLGASLGVEAMSLYHYFANKERLLDALADAVYAEVLSPPSHLPWIEALRQRCESMRSALQRHPWAISLIGARTQPGPHTLGHLNRVLGCLRTAGLGWSEVGHAVALIDAYVLGFAVQEQSLPLQDPKQTSDAAEAILAPGLEEHFPYLASFITEHALRPGYAFAREFDAGLERVLKSVEGWGKGESRVP